LVEASPRNAQTVFKAPRAFGAPLSDIAAADFSILEE
jgi:hypothetical protein